MTSVSTSTNAETRPVQPKRTSTGPLKRGRKRALSCSELNSNEIKASDSASCPKRRRRKAAETTGPAFNEIPSDVDVNWTDIPENETSYGPRPDQLARLITRPCYPSKDPELWGDNLHFRCIASSVCGWRQKVKDRQLPRIFRHAVRCHALAYWKPDLFAAAERAFANTAPGGLEALDQAPTSELAPQAIPSAESLHQFTNPTNPFAQFDPTTHMTHLQQIDHAIARLICDSGTPTRLVDYTAWKNLLYLVNPNLDYSSPSSSYVREKLIPTESMRAVLHMREFLKTQTNLSLSFDGLTAGEQPVYTVHVCTPDRYTFLYYADIFYGSHDSNYIEDLLVKVVAELGPHRISSVVSDDTSVTRKARLLVTARNTSIMNLADPIHKLNLCIQDICLDRLWTSIIDRLRKLLKHFKMSTHATGKLNAARKVLGIVRTLQSIGKTRFATIYYAALSVLENLPALYQIYRNGDIDTKGNPLPDVVAEALDENQITSFEFKAMLTELVRILEPLARALLCLESTHSTISDIYFFWLAALASLNRNFGSKSSGHLLTSQDKSRLQAIIYYRFSEAINEAPTDAYVTGFFLDPRYRTIPIYLDSSNVHTPHPVVAFDYSPSSRRKTARPASRLMQSLYSRVRRQLLSMLRDELSIGQTTPEHPLYQYDALRAKNELIAQLQQYQQGLPPFRQFSGDEGALQYWMSHKGLHLTFILAYLAEKLFSIMPNSMCDERAGSRLTRLYSDLRTQLDAKSMIEQIQFSQFMNLVDSSESTACRRKSPARLRFYDIDQATISNHVESSSMHDHVAALFDESGEQWLDGRNVKGTVNEPTPEFGECPSLAGALKAHCVDLNSEVLMSALNTIPDDKMDAFPSESQVASGDTAEIPFTTVSEVSWDSD